MRFTNVNPGEHPELIIAGIGRPEKKFEDARASVAFRVIDYLDSISMKSSGCKRKLHSALCDKCMLEGNIVFLAKPQVFIKNAGMSVSDMMSYYRMRSDKLIVIHEDTSVPAGKITIDYGNTDFTHDGLVSVKHYLKTSDFVRIGVGIGKPENEEDTAEYLLSPLTKDELELIVGKFDMIKRIIVLLTKYTISDTIRAFRETELGN